MAAADCVIEIEGVTTGESARKKGAIDIESISWGATQTGSGHISTGMGSGKVVLQDVHMTKLTDKTTPTLFEACCSGKHFKKATITFFKAAGEKSIEFLKVELEEVMVSSYQASGSGSGIPHESLSLNFKKQIMTYTGQKNDGSADSPVRAGWNSAENVKA